VVDVNGPPFTQVDALLELKETALAVEIKGWKIYFGDECYRYQEELSDDDALRRIQGTAVY